MDFLHLCQDFGISVAPESHKHYREGWVNVECPFCTGHSGYHLGYNEEEDYFYCWRCGWHSMSEVLFTLTHTSPKKLLEEYSGSSSVLKHPSIQKKQHELPSNIVPITKNSIYYRYLAKRFSNPDYIVKTWNLMGTGPVSLLDGIDYKLRILIPIYWEGEMVSFTSRDVTGKTELRYLTCPRSREKIHHKTIIYRHPSYKEKEGICVEGPFDVWKLGKIAFCTFGIGFTNQQIRTIAKLYTKVGVLFDNEDKAQEKARLLVSELKFRGVNAYLLPLPRNRKDPGELQEDEVLQIISNI